VQLYKDLLAYVHDRYAGDYWPALPKDVAAYVLKGNTRDTPAIVSPLRNGEGENGMSKGDVESGFNLNGREPANASAVSATGSDSKSGSASNYRKLWGKRGAVLLFSHYPADPRPRRAAEALTEEGVTIDLICLQENADEPRNEIVNGVNVTRVPLKRRRRGAFTYMWQYTAFIIVSGAYVTLRSIRKRYDFVHVHNMPDFLVFSALVPKLLGAKVVLDLHDPMPELMEAI